MDHDFRTLSIVKTPIPKDDHVIQVCVNCGLRVDLKPDGTRSQWSEISISTYPDCDTLHVAQVMET